MSLYKVSIDNSRKELAEYERRFAWNKAKLDIKIINTIGICICVYLWICVAFNAF